MSTLLILAGRRGGAQDPLAAAHNVSHKCMVPIAGRPLIHHVLDAALEAGSVAHILISIDDTAVAEGDPRMARLLLEGRLRILSAEPDLPGSILAAARAAEFPMIVTTADNVLLTGAAIDTFAGEAGAGGGEAAVAFARRESVLAAHPQGQRRFYEFRDGGFSNCNLYWIGSARALSAARIFRGGGQFAKHPVRIVAAFGILNLIRFRLRRLSLEAMMARLSRMFGLSVRAVEMADGRLAIDVDNDRTYGIAAELLVARAQDAA